MVNLKSSTPIKSESIINHKSLGFTLIELLIVIAIIGVMAAALIVVINGPGQLAKTRDAQRKSDLRQMQDALEVYYQDNGQYPAASSGTISGIAWGSAWTVTVNSKTVTYMAKLPKDPSSGRNYSYTTSASYDTYYLYTSLERTIDPQLCKSDGSVCDNASATSASCGGTCNYGATSSNTTP